MVRLLGILNLIVGVQGLGACIKEAKANNYKWDTVYLLISVLNFVVGALCVVKGGIY